MRAPLSIAAVLLLLPNAVAVHPLDDDAGSGGDAGDVAEAALPLVPGAYAGRLTGWVDLLDFYIFQASEGDVLRVELTHTGGVPVGVAVQAPGMVGVADSHRALDGDGVLEYLLPRTGPWYFGFVATEAPGWVEELGYAFRFSLGPAAAGVVVDPADGWQTVEARLDAPTDVTLYLRVDVPVHGGDAAVGFAYMSWDLETASGPTRGRVALISTIPGPGRGVAVASAPSVEVPLEFSTGAVGNWVYTLKEFPGAVGTVRLVAYGVGVARPLATLLGDVSLGASQTAAGVGVVAWSDAEAGGALQVRAPALSVTGPRDRALAVDGLFLGAFWTFGFAGSMTDPQGRTTNLGGDDDLRFLLAPAQGLWRFHLGQTYGVGPEADRIYLSGAFIPRLGLAP